VAVIEFRGRVMGSDLHIIAVEGTADMVAEIVVMLDHLERCWSRFIPSSDISRLNTARVSRLAVDDSTVALLAAMVEGHRLTGGSFDPRVLPALIEQGYAASRHDPSMRTALPDRSGPAPSLELLELDPLAGMVTVPDGLALDPGGIGKGLAGDLAAGRLLELGAIGALVSIGGDLAMAGEAVTPEGWLVEVERPDSTEEIVCTLAVRAGGVATSSTRSRRWLLDGRERHHQINPVTSLPSTTDLAAVTVIARCGWHAEVHATAALAAGSSDVLAYLVRHDVEGMAIDVSGNVMVSPALVDVEINAKVGAR
jgi:thiamine biosynthesis lipoprotein